MELSTYFRINAAKSGQFERTLIIAERAPTSAISKAAPRRKRDENQLHAAVVELVALDDAEIKYSTVQNWYPGDEDGKGGIYNFVTKRGDCRGAHPRFPGRRSRPARPSPGNIRAASCAATTRVGEFYSIAIANNYQQADTGTKMIHLGKNTRSRIISKGISAGHAQNTYRGLVQHPCQGRRRAQFHAMRLAAASAINAAPIPCPISRSRNPTASVGA